MSPRSRTTSDEPARTFTSSGAPQRPQPSPPSAATAGWRWVGTGSRAMMKSGSVLFSKIAPESAASPGSGLITMMPSAAIGCAPVTVSRGTVTRIVSGALMSYVMSGGASMRTIVFETRVRSVGCSAGRTISFHPDGSDCIEKIDARSAAVVVA